jgi:hypothetical protein
MKFFIQVRTLKVISIIPKWRTYKLLRWVQLLNRVVDLAEILCECDGLEGDLNFNNVSTIP